MFVGRSSTSFSTATLVALLCCTFLIVIDIEHVTSMSIDRLAVDRNEIETEKQEQEDYSANSNIIVDDMELEAIPAAAAGVAGDTELYVLLPVDSVNEADSIDQNTIEENMSMAEDEESSSNLVESGGDMLMMETNDTPAAMQAVLMPVEVAPGASEMESEATSEVESDKIDELSLPAQELVLGATNSAISLMSDEITSEQEVVQKDDHKLLADLTDTVEMDSASNQEATEVETIDSSVAQVEQAETTNVDSASNQEATNAEEINFSEAQVDQAETTNVELVDKADAEPESVADTIVDDMAEKNIESELVTDEELKIKADHISETNNDHQQVVPTMEIAEKKESAEKLSGEDVNQEAKIESVTDSIQETQSDIIESLTAAIDAMLPEETAASELQTEAEKEQGENLEQHTETSKAEIAPEEAQAEIEVETVKEEPMPEDKLDVLAQTDDATEQSEAEIVPDEVQAEIEMETVMDELMPVKKLDLLPETDDAQKQTEAAEDTNLEEVVNSEENKEEQSNPQAVDEQVLQEESMIESIAPQAEAVEEDQIVAETQEENEITEEKHEEIMQNLDVQKDEAISEVVSEEVTKVESNDTEKVEEVSNTQDQEQEVKLVNHEIETLNISNEAVEEAENSQSLNAAIVQDVLQSVEQTQEIQQTETEEEKQEVQLENVSNDEEDENKQGEVIVSENIQDTPMKVEESGDVENETEVKLDGTLMAEAAQPETIISAPDTEEPQQINEVVTENTISTAVNGEEPQTDAAAVDSALTTEDKQQITLMDTVAPAIQVPTQEITEKIEAQKTDESESTAISADKQQIILMDDTTVPQGIISTQEENAEEPQKPEQTESTSILTTIIQVPQELQMQIQDATEESTPTKVENEAAEIIAATPQDILQEAAEVVPAAVAAVVESTTQKPLIVADSVLNYVNASLMQQNNNKPLQDDELFNSKLRRYDGAQVWRIVVQNDKDKKLADELQSKYGGQLWKEVKQEVDYLLKPQILAEAEKHIRAANLSRIVLIDNLQKVIEVENPPADQIALLQNRKGHRLTWQAYHRLDDIHGFFDYLAKTYPDICAVETIGYSVQKRPLKILKISNGNAGNPGIWLDGGMHAREWISPASVTYVANQIVEGWDDLPAYMRNVNWYIHAVANPDGYEYSHTTDRLWRKNMRSHGRQCPGVDLNRNFGYKWGGKGTSANPCSQTYRGSKAFSEPETFYISKFISNFPRETFQAYLSFHSYGQYILYPWGYDYHLTKDRSDLDRVARQAGTIITRGSGVKYTVGSSATTLYPAAGGSDDWAKGIAGIKYAYTIELGDTGRYGFVLPASLIEDNGKDSFTFAETVARAVTLGLESRKRAL